MLAIVPTVNEDFYVCIVLNSCERRFAEHVERSVPDCDLYYPCRRERNKLGNIVEYPVIPGYVFLSFKDDVTRWQIIHKHSAFLHLLSRPLGTDCESEATNVPVRVASRDILDFINRELAGEFDSTITILNDTHIHVDDLIGETVKIPHGQFYNMQGEILRRRKKLYDVEIKVFGRETIVSVMVCDIYKSLGKTPLYGKRDDQTAVA